MVEVRFGLSWKPACGALWNIYASRAVCRWLGCGESELLEEPIPPTPELTPSPATGNTSWAPNVTRALAPTIRCSSPEWQLCEVVEHHCSNEGLVQVTCAGTKGPTPTLGPAPTFPSLQPLPLPPVPNLGTVPKPHPPDVHHHHRRAAALCTPGTQIGRVPTVP